MPSDAYSTYCAATRSRYNECDCLSGARRMKTSPKHICVTVAKTLLGCLVGIFVGLFFIPNTLVTMSHPLEYVIVVGGALVGGIVALQIRTRR
jgi:hypothetical protein